MKAIVKKIAHFFNLNNKNKVKEKRHKICKYCGEHGCYCSK